LIPPPPKDPKEEKVQNKPNLVTALVNQSRTDDDKLILKITDGIE